LKQAFTKSVLILAIAAVCIVLVAPAAQAKGENVTFKNRTADTQYLLIVFGDGGQCSEMSNKEQLTLEPGEETMVESGDSTVCWCSSTFGKIADCRDSWNKTKAGKIEKIRS
jgi:hypothetical protein